MPTSEQAARLFAAVEKLDESVEGLALKTDALARLTEGQESEIKRAKRREWWLALGVVLVACILAVLAFLGFGVIDNQQKINDIQSTQRTATQVNREAQCAFLGVFFQLEANIAANPNRSAQAKVETAELFEQMHEIADTLNCAE